MKFKTSRLNSPILQTSIEISEIRVASWCPDDQAEAPPEQVHVLFGVKPLEGYNFAVRFKSRQALQGFIEALTTHRDDVWPQQEQS